MGTNVLLIDDSQTQREMISAFLEDAGFKVTLASNGKEGLERIAESTPDLIVLDIMMPEMDGYTMLKTLRKRQISVPVILLTKQKQQHLQDLLYFEQYSYYLEKPFKVEELIAKIKGILQK